MHLLICVCRAKFLFGQIRHRLPQVHSRDDFSGKGSCKNPTHGQIWKRAKLDECRGDHYHGLRLSKESSESPKT